MEHSGEIAAKLDNYQKLKKAGRSLVIQVLNLTDSSVELAHSQMQTGTHKTSSSRTVAPAKYE